MQEAICDLGLQLDLHRKIGETLTGGESKEKTGK